MYVPLMRMRDLLAMPDLHLRLLHGDEESLDRPLRRTYSSDLMDPGRYLRGGELVVSGLVWRTCPEDSETFVANVARAGGAGLAAGEVMFAEVPADVIEACQRHNLLLFGVPEEVSFTQINEAVIGATSAARGDRLEATLGRYRKMLTAVAEGRQLEELIDSVSADNNLVCRVLTATGRHICRGPAPLTKNDLDRVTCAFQTSHRLPALVVGDAGASHKGNTYSIFGVGPALGQRALSWMIVVEGDWSTMSTTAVDAVRELAAITQLERTRRDESLRASRSRADDVINLVTEGSGNRPETILQLRQAGLDPERSLAVMVAGLGQTNWGEELRSIIDDAVSNLGPSVVAPGPDGHTVALVQADHPDFSSRLRESLLRLTPGMTRTPLTVGISDAAPLAALSGMWEEARHARNLAELSTDPVSVVTGAEVTSYVLLLATVPDDVRRTFAHRVLGPVWDYDRKHHAGLNETLEAFLACSGSWSRTAEQMHVHVNTVRYRIQRVEELTGRDLSSLEDRVDVFLALRSLP